MSDSGQAKPYTVEAWQEVSGRWLARVHFAFPGLGNTGPAEEMKYRGLRAAKLALKKQVAHRVRYEIVDNKIDQLNRLHSLTVGISGEGRTNG